jgi:hypothetical protein
MNETRYSLKELQAMFKERSISSSEFRHPGRVIRCELGVNDKGARIIRTAEFPVGDGDDTKVAEVTSVL